MMANRYIRVNGKSGSCLSLSHLLCAIVQNDENWIPANNDDYTLSLNLE